MLTGQLLALLYSYCTIRILFTISLSSSFSELLFLLHNILLCEGLGKDDTCLLEHIFNEKLYIFLFLVTVL